VASIANPQLSPVRNFDRGFDTFQNLRILKDEDWFEDSDGETDDIGPSHIERVGRKLMSLGEALPVDPSLAAFLDYRFYQLRTDWPTVDGADVISNLLENLPDEDKTPFFAWTHLNDIHCPIHPIRARRGGIVDAGNISQFAADFNRTRHQLSPRYELMYDSIIRYVDAQVGRLMDALKQRGQYEDTLIIVTADHGEALFDRGIYEHASGEEQQLHDGDRDYLYRELLNVPLLIRPPGGDMTPRVTSPFSLTWLHAAIADLTELPPGDFPESPTKRFNQTTDMVFADTLTENGHTVAALTDECKVITDSTTPTATDSSEWYWFDRRDVGERVRQRPTEALIPEVKSRIVDPKSLQRGEDAISNETKRQLANLGYR
jgi:choline-sulfatase